MPPLLDIVIPVFGEADKLDQCRASLKAQAFQDFRITLVDDRSPDPEVMAPTYKSFLEDFPNGRARLVRHDRNMGFPQTVNDGAAKGSAPLILLLNSDVVLEPEALATLVYELDNPRVGVVGALLMFPEGSQWGPAGTVQHAGLAIDVFGKPFHIHVGWPADHKRIRWSDEFQAVTGACFMTRRVLWNKIGGMNKLYGRGTYEDVDYCYDAARNYQMKIVFTPKARGTHHVGASIMAVNSGYPMQQNELIYRQRWQLRWDEYQLW
jgi:GT2 family glycosyltransferase